MARGTLRVATSGTALEAEHGRILERLLRRGEELPERKPGEQLVRTDYAPHAVALARHNWLERMYHEHQSAAVFSGLLPQLIEAEAPLDVKTAVMRSSIDELRHAGLCGQVVEMLGGQATYGDCELRVDPLPEHPGCTPRERALRNLTFASCFSETVSVALLTEERGRAEEPFVQRVLRQLAGDEVLHARIGWLYLETTLAQLDDAARERTARWLAPALAYFESCLLAAMPVAPTPIAEPILADASALGFSESRRARSLLYDAIESVIVPRLEQLGLPAERAWAERDAARDLIDERMPSH